MNPDSILLLKVIQNLPRLLRDIELLQNEVVHFQRKLATVEHDVSKVENETTNSLEYIIKLDSVKKKLKATSKALQEADNWTTLMADIEEVRFKILMNNTTSKCMHDFIFSSYLNPMILWLFHNVSAV